MADIRRDARGELRVTAAAPSARLRPEQAADPESVGHRRRDRILDIVLPLVLLLPAVAGTLTGGDQPQRIPNSRPVAVAVAVAGTLALLVRRRRPIVALGAVVAAAAIVEWPLAGPGWIMQLPIVCAAYTVGTLRPWRRAAAAGVIAWAVQAGADNVARGWEPGNAVSQLALIGGAVAVGLYVSTRRAYVASLHERARRLERERDLLTHQAVADERVRIARELHDVVAHHVSLLVVQAGAVRETLPPDHTARPVLDSMAATGRAAMGEMRRMLGLLRVEDPSSDDAMGPQPGADDIATLVERTRATGVDVELRVDGEPRAVPVGVGLSAYRIVQEALTNVVKHAGPAHAVVRLAYADDTLEIKVVDDGRGTGVVQLDGDGGGHGLVGMRERVALFGGELTAGPRRGGGFSVVARLPTVDEGRGR
jgi:signal transduction histidine kinase